MLYLCNGSNLKDLATLKWDDDSIHGTEFSFIRSKVENKLPIIVNIPITEALKSLLAKYASVPIMGTLVFPQILLGAQTESQIANRIHDFNSTIRKGAWRMYMPNLASVPSLLPQPETPTLPPSHGMAFRTPSSIQWSAMPMEKMSFEAIKAPSAQRKG